MKKKNDLIITAFIILMVLSFVVMEVAIFCYNPTLLKIGMITMSVSFFGICYGCTVE